MIRLNRRESLLMLVMAGLVAAWVLWSVWVAPARQRQKTLRRVIPEKTAMLSRLKTLSSEYLALQAGLDELKGRIARQDRTAELPTVLEAMVKQLGLDKNVRTMKQQTSELSGQYNLSVVEVELESATFEQLVGFLFKIKSSNGTFQIRSLYVRHNTASPETLDATVEIAAPKPGNRQGEVSQPDAITL